MAENGLRVDSFNKGVPREAVEVREKLAKKTFRVGGATKQQLPDMFIRDFVGVGAAADSPSVQLDSSANRPDIKTIADFQRHDLPRLQRLEAEGHMSPELRAAVKETREAIERGDLSRAADVSAVKSYVVDEDKFPNAKAENHFRENATYNEKVLGNDAYSYLGGVHFDLAMAQGELPSGMARLRAEGTTEKPMIKMYSRPQSTKPSPTIRLMNREHREIERRYGHHA